MNIHISASISEEEAVMRWLSERGLVAIDFDVAGRLAHNDLGKNNVIFDAHKCIYRKHPEWTDSE